MYLSTKELWAYTNVGFRIEVVKESEIPIFPAIAS